jgi:uncharacterized lipoprotein NlpE involved in copper resistance
MICIAGSFFCKTQSSNKTNEMATGHNSRNSLDWQGTYNGILPCADCEGIQTVILLNSDLTYTLKTKYLGKADSVFESSGTFNWNDSGNTITLNNIENNRSASYFVGENTLTQLDLKGNKITGDLANSYILKKTDNSILEKYWKLTELYGKPVTVDSTYTKEPHIIFKEKDRRVIGNGGCNNFSGTYELKNNNGIILSKMIATQMACKNMDTESQFFKVLQMANNYYLTGDTLHHWQDSQLFI